MVRIPITGIKNFLNTAIAGINRMVLNTCFYHMDRNGIKEAVNRLATVSDEELKQRSKKPLLDYIVGTSLFDVFWSEKSSQRYYNRIVARRMIKKGTRDLHTIVYNR